MLNLSSQLVSSNQARLAQAARALEEAAAAGLSKSTPPPSQPLASGQVLRSPANPLTSALSQVDSALVSRLGADIDTAQLKNLGEKLDGIDTAAVRSAADRFLQSAIGLGVHASTRGSPLDDLGGPASDARSRNPLDNQPSTMILGRTGMLSDDPPATDGSASSAGSSNSSSSASSSSSSSSSTWDDIKNFFGGVVGMIFGGAGTRTPAGAVAGSTAGAVAGTAMGVLTANTGSVDDKKNEANGIFGIFRQGKTGTVNQTEAEMLKAADDGLSPGGNKGTPVPTDDAPSSTPHVTGGMIDALKALRGAASTPVNDDGSGSTTGGQVNTGVDGTGKLGSLSQPVNDDTNPARIAVTRFDLIGIEARVTSKINIIG